MGNSVFKQKKLSISILKKWLIGKTPKRFNLISDSLLQKELIQNLKQMKNILILVNKIAKRHSIGNILNIKIQRWDTSERTLSSHAYKYIIADLTIRTLNSDVLSFLECYNLVVTICSSYFIKLFNHFF
jgi:hypothetical protein